MKLPAWIAPRHAKLIIPTAGLFGLYVGAFIGQWVLSGHKAAMPGIAIFFVEGLLALTLGFAVTIPVDTKLGPNAAHVDLLKLPQYWFVAGCALYVASWIVRTATPWDLPAFFINLVLWLAGFFAIWTDEPDWPKSWLAAALRGRRRR